MSESSILWVGGSSALARTYFEEVHPARGLSKIIVAAPELPPWPFPEGVTFAPLDLASEESIRSLFTRSLKINTLVLSVRLSLVWAKPQEHARLVQHLDLLLRCAADAGCTSVLHISSIAVADHVETQHMIRESDPLPPLEQIKSPYDRFKLESEHAVDRVCSADSRVHVWTHLRLSGIFSNDPRCIQCSAIRNQALVSLKTPVAIDFNSSKNASHAMALVLQRQMLRSGSYSGRHLFFYTRGTLSPVPYWTHVADYRRANGIWYGLMLPGWIGEVAVPVMRAAMRAAGTDLAGSLDYLMAVASHEHSADNSLFRSSFPEIARVEETILECFQRLRVRNEGKGGDAKQNASSSVWMLGGAIIALLVLMIVVNMAVASSSP